MRVNQTGSTAFRNIQMCNQNHSSFFLNGTGGLGTSSLGSHNKLEADEDLSPGLPIPGPSHQSPECFSQRKQTKIGNTHSGSQAALGRTLLDVAAFGWFLRGSLECPEGQGTCLLRKFLPPHLKACQWRHLRWASGQFQDGAGHAPCKTRLKVMQYQPSLLIIRDMANSANCVQVRKSILDSRSSGERPCSVTLA